MTDLVGALAPNDQLSDFDGMPVLTVGISLTNAGDGLSQALRIEPRELHQGDEVFILTRGIVQKVRFEPIDREDPAGPQRRVHIVRAGTATLVDQEFAAARIEDQAERIRLAEEAAHGITRLPDEGTIHVGPDGDGEPVDEDGFHDPALPAPTPFKKPRAPRKPKAAE